jgi:hypothetical protein
MRGAQIRRISLTVFAFFGTLGQNDLAGVVAIE